MSIPVVILGIFFGTACYVTMLRINLSDMDSGRRIGSGGCESGGCKTIGAREIQEDYYGVVENEHGTMAVLADGMGKCFGGRIASRIAVETFQNMFCETNAFYNPQYYFKKAFHAANHEIVNQLNGERGSASVAAVMVKDRKLYYAVVGNVRVAVYRKGDLIPVSSGHTINVLAKQQYTEGKLTKQEAISLLEHHRLYNYVGQDGFHDIEFFDTPITLNGGEIITLMSDGLYDSLSWKAIEDCLAGGGSCNEMALELIELINHRTDEEQDNASVVLLRVG